MFHRLYTHRYRYPGLLRVEPEPGLLTVSTTVITFLLLTIVLAAIILEFIASAASGSGASGTSYSKEETKCDTALKL